MGAAVARAEPKVQAPTRRTAAAEILKAARRAKATAAVTAMAMAMAMATGTANRATARTATRAPDKAKASRVMVEGKVGAVVMVVEQEAAVDPTRYLQISRMEAMTMSSRVSCAKPQ